jgi:hypothetical protein
MHKFTPFVIFAALPVHAAPSVRISVDRSAVPEGRSVIVSAQARNANGAPATGARLSPYVNGKRWGAEATTNARGRAEWPLPLPNPGAARIEVVVEPPAFRPKAHWIWAPRTDDNQTVYFQKPFRMPGMPSAATLTIAADDRFEAWVNGHLVARGTDFHHVERVTGLERWLTPGDNVLAVRATNAIGPGGLLAEIAARLPERRVTVPSDATWAVGGGDSEPPHWPNTLLFGAKAKVIAPVGQDAWSNLAGWPGYTPPVRYPVGLPMPADAVRSNAVTVRVTKRPFPKVIRDPDHLVGVEWEPWFTPNNIPFSTGEAVPLLGRYDSFNRDVIRQHALWLVGAGVDFILVDWTNNLWDKQHWSERAPAVDELVKATTTMLDVYAKMRKEGIPVPRVALLPSLENGVRTTTTAINEQNQWVADNYLKNARYNGLWLTHEGKPLIVVFNGSGPKALEGQPPVRSSDFTVRWMASQLQGNHFEKAGYWSWMDGVPHPIPTYHNGKAEALTVTPAFFGDGGWTAAPAMARRGGATFAEQFRYARTIRPRFLIINQWNEFAGQPIGGGYGEQHDVFVDSYSVPLSNDIEPTSTTMRGYRGDLGYGFFYQNLTRALIAYYHGDAASDTILTVAAPDRNTTVKGESLAVEWHAIGRPATSYSVELDGRTVAANAHGTKADVSLKGLKPGAHRLTVRANGATTHFPLSTTREDLPLARPVPTVVNVAFTLER